MIVLSLFTFQSGTFCGQQSSSDNLDWLKYIVVPLVVAGIAVWGNLRQVKINIITASQVKWIDDLRETLSEYLTELKNGLLYYQNHAVDMGNKHQPINSEQNLNYHKYTDSINTASRLTLKIVLYLNSKNEQSHQNLENRISDINNLVVTLMSNNAPTLNDIIKCRNDVSEMLHDIVELSRIIIAEEMKKINNNKLWFLKWGNKT